MQMYTVYIFPVWLMWFCILFCQVYIEEEIDEDGGTIDFPEFLTLVSKAY